MEEIEHEGQSAKQTAKDLFSGASGGIAQVLIGQPFDIVKVRLQTTTAYTSALDGARKIYTQEGPLAFYKGTLTPLIGIGACVSVQFGGFHYARRWFERRNASASNSTPGSASTPSPPNSTSSPLTYAQYYASGAFAGITNSVLAGPIEHIRIRLQTQPPAPTPSQRLYPTPLSCIRTLLSHGGLAGLYRGQAVTILREGVAYGTWFLTYEYLMNADVRRRGLGSRKEVEAWRLAGYGAAAGEMLWLSSYPFDVVKSRMQSDGLGPAKALGKSANGAIPATEATGGQAATGTGSAAEGVKEVAAKHFGHRKYANMRDCFAQTWREEGARGFWKGIGPTLLRAMPVSAATFVVAEMVGRVLS